MKRNLILLLAVLAASSAAAQQDGLRDWANYGRYAEDNARLKALGVRPDVVFMGNSITDAWPREHPAFFEAGGYAGRGISGQVTAQMLARFRADVLDLGPRVVVILAGTNDIARNDGYVATENIAANIFSMAEIARAHNIEVAICSVLPAAGYPWRPEVTDAAAKVQELNAMLAEWARENGCTYVDYWSAMADERGGLPATLAADGIHPNPDGYTIMENTIAPVIERLLGMGKTH